MRFRCLLLLLLASPLAALAQSWPTQTVRVMVGFPPGGTTDIVGRLVANELSEQLGRTLVVENRGGASGTIGAGLVASTPYVFVVHPDMPVKSFGELIALLKANPGKYNYASTSPGTAQHLGGELVKKMAGVDMVHIATITQHIRKGTLRPLAVSSIKRTPLMPESADRFRDRPGPRGLRSARLVRAARAREDAPGRIIREAAIMIN